MALNWRSLMKISDLGSEGLVLRRRDVVQNDKFI